MCVCVCVCVCSVCNDVADMLEGAVQQSFVGMIQGSSVKFAHLSF